MTLEEWYLRLTSDLHTQNRYSRHEWSNKHVERAQLLAKAIYTNGFIHHQSPGRQIIFRTLSALESPSACWDKPTSRWLTILCQSYQTQPLLSSLCGCQIHWGWDLALHLGSQGPSQGACWGESGRHTDGISGGLTNTLVTAPLFIGYIKSEGCWRPLPTQVRLPLLLIFLILVDPLHCLWSIK